VHTESPPRTAYRKKTGVRGGKGKKFKKKFQGSLAEKKPEGKTTLPSAKHKEKKKEPIETGKGAY